MMLDANASLESKRSFTSNDTARTWTVLRPVEPEVLQRMLLYQTKSAYYLLGYNGEETHCRLLIFSRKTTEHEYLDVIEDPQTLTPHQAAELLQNIHAKDSANGGLQLLCEAYGILGCFRFLEGYYLFLITKRKPLGSVAGHTVYGIADTALIPLSPSNDSWSERRYRKLLLSGVDLTKDFFFSYTYNLSYTVQHNLIHQENFDPFDCIFVWNEYLTRDLRNALNDNKWVLPLVHGSWQQRNLSIFGKLITLTLISRRSRRFAGTRYLKRGINQHGWVANEVETEQIISLYQNTPNGIPSLSSIVQLRGSIPLFWGQGTTTLHPRPGIVLYNMDPLYSATAKHFEDLFDRYGSPLVVLNLVKSIEKHPRETILRREFGKAIAFLNQHMFKGQVVYIPWDYKEQLKKNGHYFLKELEPMIRSCVQCTGFCVIHPENGRLSTTASPYPSRSNTRSKDSLKPQIQQGVLRSNCIDCLDRTNTCQYIYGLMALGYQLCSLGLLATNEIDPNCSLAYQLMEMYEIMGNVLALQYGGSEAHGKFFERMRGHSQAATKSKEVLTSIKRYYSNAISDPEKQDAINLFLGNFIPQHDKPALWELESDYFMHCGVDWEMNESHFGPRPSSTLHSGHSIPTSSSDNLLSSTLMRRSSNQNPSSIQIFPVPVISQTGDPELTSSNEQIQKKENSNTWGFRFWLGTNKESNVVDFKLPEAKKTSLESFEELLKANPVVDVRLHDGNQKSALKHGQRLALPNLFARLSKVDDQLTDQTPSYKTDGDLLSESSSFGGCGIIVDRERSPSMLANARSAILSLHQIQETMKNDLSVSMSKNGIKLNKEIEFNSLQNSSTYGLVEELNIKPPKLLSKSLTSPGRSAGIRNWFGGLSRASTDTQKRNKPLLKDHKTTALRAASTPADVGANRYDNDEDEDNKESNSCLKAQHQRSNSVEEFWNEYWSITEQTLTSELTSAERISNASDKREALRLVNQQKQQKGYHYESVCPPSSLLSQSKNDNDLFLDNFITTLVEKKEDSIENKIPDLWTDKVFQREKDKSQFEGKVAFSMQNNDGDNQKIVKKKVGNTVLDSPKGKQINSNINELLYSSSSSGPGDRILEKWFLADQKAEHDYQRKLSSILCSVNDITSVGNKEIRA